MKLTSSYRSDLDGVADLLKPADEAGGGLVGIGAVEVGRAEVVIGKQRHGPIGTVELSFEGRFTRFGNLAKAWQSDER